MRRLVYVPLALNHHTGNQDCVIKCQGAGLRGGGQTETVDELNIISAMHDTR